MEKAMATHSSTLAWKIPCMGEPGGLPSMGSHGVGHDWSNLAAAAAAAEYMYVTKSLNQKYIVEGFPGSIVEKNLPANAGDTGSIPGPGRFHMPRSS